MLIKKQILFKILEDPGILDLGEYTHRISRAEREARPPTSPEERTARKPPIPESTRRHDRRVDGRLAKRSHLFLPPSPVISFRGYA